MLVRATADDVARYGDWVYALALDQSRSYYPTYADGIKTKAEFLADALKGVSRDNRELLLFSADDRVVGWIQYVWLPDDRYLQLCACNIERNTSRALKELLSLLAARFAGYTLYFGFPGENAQAICFLENNGFERIEQSWNHTYCFERATAFPVDPCVRKIGRERFDDFRAVYRPDPETYWSCDRILERIDQWTIFVHYDGDRPVGALFLQGDSGCYEIFGVSFADGKYHAHVLKALLCTALDDCRKMGTRYMTFFCEDEMREAVLDMGFSCVGKYVLYIKTI